jgi:dolichol-phosphate mannosyltransferase
MAAPSPPFFSLVAPTFNEHSSIATFLERAAEVLEARRPGRYEIIVVDDDSPDRTWEQAEAAAKLLPAVRVIRRRGERGLATAVVAGWQVARGDWLGVIDADLQHPPEILGPMLGAMEAGADLVVGSRHMAGGGVSDWSPGRRMISRTAQGLGLLLLPAARRVSDPMSGLCLVRRDALDLGKLQPLGYKILLEILVRGNLKRIVEVPYVFDERRRGRSKVTLRIYGEYLRHLLRLRGSGRC